MNGDVAGIALVLGLIALYAASARRLDRLSVTGAMVFTVAGLLLGAEMLDVLPATIETESVAARPLVTGGCVRQTPRWTPTCAPWNAR